MEKEACDLVHPAPPLPDPSPLMAPSPPSLSSETHRPHLCPPPSSHDLCAAPIPPAESRTQSKKGCLSSCLASGRLSGSWQMQVAMKERHSSGSTFCSPAGGVPYRGEGEGEGSAQC